MPVRPLRLLAVAASALLALASLPRAASAAATDPVPFAADAPTALVTGANRGLGLEFAKQLRASGWNVVGTARSVEEATELAATGARVEALDVASTESVAALAKRLDGLAIDMLVNNAGVGSASRSGKLEDVDVEAALRTLSVNTLGPMRVTQALLPNLRKGERKTVLCISSALGSVELNTRGGYYGYRESKSALNMFVRSLAAELKDEGFLCIAMSPGWVRTDMGGPQATLSPEESIGGMLKVIGGLTPAETGRYYAHDGAVLPW